MNLIFMNSLEKKAGEDCVKTAQVSICEYEGTYRVSWSEIDDHGNPAQADWYEGGRWEEMLEAFRSGLSHKFGDGFYPLFSGVPDVTDVPAKAKITLMLHFYSEQHDRQELFESLRQWRRDQAVKEGKAPYIIATNRLLNMICAFLPYTRDELLQLPGFGENKANIYTEAIVSLTQQYERQTAFPLDWVIEKVDSQELRSWAIKQHELRVRLEEQKQASRRKLLEAIKRGDNMDAMISQLSAPRKEILQWIEGLDREGYDLEAFIAAQLQHVPKALQDQAWKALEQVGDRYLKPVLNTLYGDKQLTTKELDRAYEWLRLLRIRFRRGKAKATQAS